jgi:hypothetical protein
LTSLDLEVMLASRPSMNSRLGNPITEANMIIKLGDEKQVHATKKRRIHLSKVSIEALFVPEFQISLLSVGLLDSFGLVAIFKDGSCTIIDQHGNNSLKATLHRGLYRLLQLGSAHSSSATNLPRLGSVHSSSPTNLPRLGSPHTYLVIYPSRLGSTHISTTILLNPQPFTRHR